MRKWLLILTIFLALALSVTGCKGTPQNTTSKEEHVTNIKFWHSLGGQNEKVIQSLIADFNTSHKDIHVEGLYIPPAERIPKILSAIAAGSPPDVATLSPQEMSSVVSSGALAPVDKLAKPGQFVKEDFYPGPLHAVTYNNKIYGVPISVGDVCLYINRDLFKAAGLDPDKPPQTWNELLEYASKLTKPEKNQWGILLPTNPVLWTTEIWSAFIRQAGGQFLDDEKSLATFNSEAGVKALQLWVDLTQKYKAAPLIPIENQPMMEQFQTGKYAMAINYPQWIEAAKAYSFPVSTAPLPKEKKYATTLGGWDLVIFNASKQKEAAWSFVEWLSSPENAVKWNIGMGSLPTSKKTMELPQYQEYVKKNPLVNAFVVSEPYSEVNSRHPKYNRAALVVAQAIQAAIYGKEPAKVALDNAAKEVNDLLSKK
ncbi:ABC transporter substrate-binding protein [Moorella naiadis]|uniref:ABC transporter substrate-binding protein n=1 Tax=Moorella naiadis (nom. illeg.) TaxID=3093670 RepID=UPI003D9CB2AA